MKFKNVIFDLDGTLLDTSGGVVESVKYTIQKLGYPMLPLQDILKFIGPPIQQSFMTYYGIDKGRAQEAAEIFREYYKTSALLNAVPYDGIYELCKALRDHNVRMSVATYKREDYALTLLQHYHFDEYCKPMHGADNHNLLKKEDIVEMCIEEMNGTTSNTVFVGDTMGDALAAEKAEVSFVAVTYGFGFQDSKDTGEYANIGTADCPKQVADIILNS